MRAASRSETQGVWPVSAPKGVTFYEPGRLSSNCNRQRYVPAGIYCCGRGDAQNDGKSHDSFLPIASQHSIRLLQVMPRTSFDIGKEGCKNSQAATAPRSITTCHLNKRDNDADDIDIVYRCSLVKCMYGICIKTYPKKHMHMSYCLNS